MFYKTEGTSWIFMKFLLFLSLTYSAFEKALRCQAFFFLESFALSACLDLSFFLKREKNPFFLGRGRGEPPLTLFNSVM